jgi:hypothetical protein
VDIPIDAYEQAAEYTRRYKDRADLITHFSAYSLDDPQQIRCSLGPAGWQTQLPDSLRIKDWYPSAPLNSETISIIARPMHHISSSARPLTLLAHFAAPTDSQSHGSSPSVSSSSRYVSGSPPSRPNRRAPTPVDILPSSTIGQLKEALLRADGRAVDKLDKVILWRVEMSEEEMVVIEQRGGLKSGQMPWPYPPTAEVPIALSNDALTVSHYFAGAQSNTRSVSVSVWIHPSASHSLARILPAEALNAPTFRYPMVFPPPEIRRPSASHSLPPASPVLDLETTVSASTLPARAAGRARRGRPSTAPPACDTLDAPSPFGGLRALRARSPLGRPPTHDAKMMGLGIAGSELPPIRISPVDEMGMDLTKLSLKVDMGASALLVPRSPEIVWQPAVGHVHRANTQSRGIRSLAHSRSLRAQETC